VIEQELDMHLNSPEFAMAVVETFEEMTKENSLKHLPYLPSTNPEFKRAQWG
jgi:hypothetical protein